MWNQDLSAFTRGLRIANYIGGEFVAARGSDSLIVESPSDEKSLITVQSSSAVDVENAVGAARRAFPSWSGKTPHQRATALHRLAALMKRDARRLAELDALCGGLCLTDALQSVASCVSCIETSASMAITTPSGFHIASFSASSSCSSSNDTTDGSKSEIFYPEVLRCPIGVCGFITPFNYPLEMGVWKFAPALAAGNTVVWKTSELAPLSAMRIAELCREAEFPRGVLNIVHGGPSCGDALSKSQDVQLIGFTGSISTGVKVQVAAASSNLKRCQLELGGNAALIVDDGISPACVARTSMSCFTHSGQSCSSIRRLLVPEKSVMAVVSAIVELIKARKVGHALDPSVEQGPLVSAAALHRVVNDVKEAVRLGQAHQICGGFRAASFPAGYFMSNTLLLCEDSTVPIVQNESFGPVLCLIPYHTLDQAIDVANGTSYGLSANVLSNNPHVLREVTMRVQAGTIWVNCADAMNATTPFGGLKRSGYGKDLGLLALDGYSTMKTITRSSRCAE